MTGSAWRRSALLMALCLGVHAAEPGPQLAYLRAAPQPEASVETPVQTPAPRAPVHEARRTLGEGNFYDPGNPDLKHLQHYDQAVADLPLDANGFPDWMRALREAKIKPWAGLKPGASMNTLDLDIVLKRTKEMPFVRFPHYAHTLWLDCSNCHPSPFEQKTGSTSITMDDIFRGKYCGMCHDRVAFITFFSCQRCHSVPQPGGVALPK